MNQKARNEAPPAENTAEETQQPAAEVPETPSNSPDKKYQELYDQHLRLAADFENFRKRQAQEIDLARKYGLETAVEQLLPFLDNLERASSSLTETSDPKLLFQSFRLVSKQLYDSLANMGIQKMKTVGEPFDPNFHEAVGQVETTDFPENAIAAEMQSGFMMGERVVRPAMVMVASSPAGAAPKSAEKPAGKTSSEDNPFAQAGETSSFNP